MQIQAMLKALSDKSRFKIIELLLQKNYCVRALSYKMGISESAVSQHIKVLKEAGLLVGNKCGYHVHYRVNKEVLHQLAKEIEELANTVNENNQPQTCRCNCNIKNRCKE